MLCCVLVVICFAFGSAFGQIRSGGDNASSKSLGPGKYSQGKKKLDGKKDTVVFKMKVYQFQNGYSRLKETKLDTVFADYQTYNPVYKKSLSVQSLGNLGSSVQSNDYFERSFDPKEFLFLQNYKYFLNRYD